MLRHWSTEHPNQLDLHFHTRFFSSFSTCCNSCSSIDSRRWRGLGGERISRINISNLSISSRLVSSWVFVSHPEDVLASWFEGLELWFDVVGRTNPRRGLFFFLFIIHHSFIHLFRSFIIIMTLQIVMRPWDLFLLLIDPLFSLKIFMATIQRRLLKVIVEEMNDEIGLSPLGIQCSERKLRADLQTRTERQRRWVSTRSRSTKVKTDFIHSFTIGSTNRWTRKCSGFLLSTSARRGERGENSFILLFLLQCLLFIRISLGRLIRSWPFIVVVFSSSLFSFFSFSSTSLGASRSIRELRVHLAWRPCPPMISRLSTPIREFSVGFQQMSNA